MDKKTVEHLIMALDSDIENIADEYHNDIIQIETAKRLKNVFGPVQDINIIDEVFDNEIIKLTHQSEHKLVRMNAMKDARNTVIECSDIPELQQLIKNQNEGA